MASAFFLWICLAGYIRYLKSFVKADDIYFNEGMKKWEVRENMSTDVIDYLREIEVQIEYKRREAEEKLQSLDASHRKSLEGIQRHYQAELNSHTEIKAFEMKEKLQQEEDALKDSYLQKQELLRVQFETERDQLVNRIVKEVLSQYGYRPNEETNFSSGTE